MVLGFDYWSTMGAARKVNLPIAKVESEKGFKNWCRNLSPQSKRRLRFCCKWFGPPLIVLAVAILILSQTIFKFRDPEITLTDVKFTGVTVDATKPLTANSVNASLSANMNVRNPNRYNFKFSNSTIHVVYHEIMVGNISMPAGEIRAQRAVDLPALVTVGSLRLGRAFGNLTQDLVKDVLPFSMSTMIPGRVNVVHLFKLDVKLEFHCDVTFWIGNSTIKDYLCWRKVHMWWDLLLLGQRLIDFNVCWSKSKWLLSAF